MGSFQRYFSKCFDWFAALAVVVMTLLVFFQVANRYIIGWVVPWTEEVSRILFIWITFVGAYIALKMHSHIAVSSFFNRFTPKNQERISSVLIFLVFYFIGYLFWLSLKVIPATFGVTTPVLEISYLYIHLSFPIFIGLMFLYLIGRIFQMGWRRLVFSCLASLAFLAVLYLLFGFKPYSGPVLVVVSLVCTGLLITFSMPIVFALGIGCALFLVLFKNYPHQIMHTRMVGGIDSFPLLAVPFFILAGELLNTGGVTTRLVALAKVLVGSIRGGLGMVTVLGEYFFSGISGSTVADVSAIGSVMVPALKKAGYKSDETVSIVSAASAMGMLVPPSIPAVVLGGITGMSVGALFVGGFIPAMVLMACIMVLIYIQAIRSKIPAEKRLPFKDAMKAVVGAVIPLLCPVIIFAGILTGAATPTEIAVIAVLYAFIVGVFVYKEIKWNQIIPILRGTAVTTGSVMLLVGIASALSWILSTNQVPNIVGTAITKLSKFSPGLSSSLQSVFHRSGGRSGRRSGHAHPGSDFPALRRQVGNQSNPFRDIVHCVSGHRDLSSSHWHGDVHRMQLCTNRRRKDVPFLRTLPARFLDRPFHHHLCALVHPRSGENFLPDEMKEVHSKPGFPA